MEISRKDTQRLENEFIVRVEELTDENIYACYQCGKCSAGCPIAEEMDILPNQIMRWVQIGRRKKVLNSKTVWFCSSCLQCAAKCPKGIDVAKVMDTLRDMAKRDGTERLELVKIVKKMWAKLPQQAIVAKFRKYTD